MRFIIISLLIISLIAGSSCRRDHYKVNTSSINVNIGIKRLEKDMFSISPEKIAESVPVLREKYSGFLQYFSYVIKTGDINEPSFGDMLVRFCTDRLNNEVYDSVMKVFPEVSGIENGLEDAFRHYIYYFPERKVPSVYTCITGFNYSIIASDSILGISLDRYLGAHSRYYPQLGIYSYISARMTPLNVVPDCMYGWADSEWIFDSTGYAVDNVLSRMIHYGKLKYFEKCMLPDEPDELIFGFQPARWISAGTMSSRCGSTSSNTICFSALNSSKYASLLKMLLLLHILQTNHPEGPQTGLGSG